MDSLYDGRKKTGYSLEEVYFHAENQRLIKELRAKNGSDTSDEEEQSEGVVIDAGSRFEQRREEAASKAAQTANKKAA